MQYGIYRLHPVVDTPGYACLVLEDVTAIAHGHTLLTDFNPPNVLTRGWQMPRLAHVWRRPKVTDPLPGQLNDYPCAGLRIPTFSQRAVEALRKLLEPNGEILPFDCDTGNYYAYNVTTVADVLDLAESIIEWPPLVRIGKRAPIIAREIHHYEFVSDRLRGLAIFRIPEDIVGYYVTQEFADCVRRQNLQGFNLQKVWPLPKPRVPGGIAEMERRAGSS